MSAHLDKHTKQIASAVSLAAQQADLGYILITFTAADYATLIKQLQDPFRMKGSFLHGCAGNVPREAIPLILGLVQAGRLVGRGKPITLPARCPNCAGTGWAAPTNEGTPLSPCKPCKGSGEHLRPAATTTTW